VWPPHQPMLRSWHSLFTPMIRQTTVISYYCIFTQSPASPTSPTRPTFLALLLLHPYPGGSVCRTKYQLQASVSLPNRLPARLCVTSSSHRLHISQPRISPLLHRACVLSQRHSSPCKPTNLPACRHAGLTEPGPILTRGDFSSSETRPDDNVLVLVPVPTATSASHP